MTSAAQASASGASASPSAAQVTKALNLLEYLASKQGVMEQRQCDAEGNGTDASRMLEQWTRGKHANPSENARGFLRKRVILCKSWKATSYASIFGEKDFVRAEKQLVKFAEQFVRGEMTDHADSEYYDEIGASLAWMPIWRGKECMANEIWLETTHMSSEYKKALELEPLLPNEGEGYNELYKVMHELMLPLNTRFEGNHHLKDPSSWKAIRHALRRVSLKPTAEHPFEKVFKMSPDELFSALPEDIKDFLEACPWSAGIRDPREKFTRGVCFWNEYYKDRVKRASEPENYKGFWWAEADLVDKFMVEQKPHIVQHFSKLRRPEPSSIVAARYANEGGARSPVAASVVDDMATKRPRISIDVDEEERLARLGSLSIQGESDERQHHSQPR